MKSVDEKSSTYINFIKENNKEGPKFKVSDHVRISKYKKNFPNCSEEIFVIKKVKKLLERFMKKNCKKQIKKSFELKK